MLPGTSTREYVIFDGIDKSISFMDFVQQIESFPYCINAFSSSKDMEHVVPIYLYGEALRFYETLDPDEQEDWEQLRSEMAWKFPGTIRSGGLVRRSSTRWEEDGLPTLAQTPPVSASKLALSVTVTDQGEERDTQDVLRQKGQPLSLSSLKGRFRVPSFSRTPGPTEKVPLVGTHLTVHSMIIKYAHGGAIGMPITTSLQARVDLSDLRAVAAAKQGLLITIPNTADAQRYLVGFTYTFRCEETSIYFCHEVLAPRKSKLTYRQQTTEQIGSPTREMSQAYPITNFIYDHKNPHSPVPPPGTYTITSYLWSGIPRTGRTKQVEKLGEIRWMLEVA